MSLNSKSKAIITDGPVRMEELLIQKVADNGTMNGIIYTIMRRTAEEN
jgi:hypothetical protein